MIVGAATTAELCAVIAAAASPPPDLDWDEMAIDDRGNNHLIWGEGLNWDSPGSIWYARGR